MWEVCFFPARVRIMTFRKWHERASTCISTLECDCELAECDENNPFARLPHLPRKWRALRCGTIDSSFLLWSTNPHYCPEQCKRNRFKGTGTKIAADLHCIAESPRRCV